MSWKITGVNRTNINFNEDQEKTWHGPFYFIQGADIQFGLIQRELEKNPVPGWEKEKVLAELAVEKLNKMKPKPKFFVICGDLCDAFGDVQPEVRAAQDADFKRIFAKVGPDIPLVCICGNHDVGDNPTVQTVEKYRNDYGDDYFSFWAGGIFCIAINSQFYHNAPLVPQLVSEQDQWLDRQLEIACTCSTHTVVFQHVPWFLDNPETKEVEYFCIEHDTRKRIMEKLIAAGIRYVFCGHYHRNSGGFYKNLEVIVTSAMGGQLGNDQPGMRIVKVYEDRITHEYLSFEDLPENITV